MESALKVGYMELDTASAYNNERDNLFIQTKLWRSFVGPVENGEPKCDPELREYLKMIGVELIFG